MKRDLLIAVRLTRKTSKRSTRFDLPKTIYRSESATHASQLTLIVMRAIIAYTYESPSIHF